MIIGHGTFIFLISLRLDSEPKSELLVLEKFHSLEVLFKVINICLTQRLHITYEKQSRLSAFPHILTYIFTEINSINMDKTSSKPVQWTTLIKWFFYHLCIVSDSNNKLNIPSLIRTNDRIFFEVPQESTFPPEILSIITKKDYSFLFDFIKREDMSSPEYLSFLKYLMTDVNGHEYLLIPEIPLELRQQLTNFYDLLIETFNSLTFTDENEILEAPHVLDYLKTIRNFLGPEDEFNNLTRSSKTV